MWQYSLSLWALLGACLAMALGDLRRRKFFGPLYPLAVLASVPFLATQGAAGPLVLAYSLAMVGVGLWFAWSGVWGAGDALALGVVALQPLVLVLAAGAAAAGVAGWRLRRGPAPPAFASFWAAAEGGRPDPGLPYAAVLGLAAAPFLALALLSA